MLTTHTTRKLLVMILSAFSLTALPLFLAAQQPTPPPDIPAYKTTPHAWAWDGHSWRELPANNARVVDQPGGQRGKQLTGTLRLDGFQPVPALPGQNLQLALRTKDGLQTHKGLPEGESGIEVAPLDSTPGPGRKQVTRTAPLERLGEAAATLGARRVPITVRETKAESGVYHLIQVTAPLAPGLYALYFPDHAFEFAVAAAQPAQQPAAAAQPPATYTPPPAPAESPAPPPPAATQPPPVDTPPPAITEPLASPPPAAEEPPPPPPAAEEMPAPPPAAEQPPAVEPTPSAAQQPNVTNANAQQATPDDQPPPPPAKKAKGKKGKKNKPAPPPVEPPAPAEPPAEPPAPAEPSTPAPAPDTAPQEQPAE